MGASISVSIVSYNTREATLACLGSVLASGGDLRLDVTVVDNASTDGSADAIAERFPGVRLIRNATNRFFSGAHNQALRDATADYLLILNSDTVLGADALARLVGFLEAHPEVGAVTCLYIDPHGTRARSHLHNYWSYHSLLYNFFGRHIVGHRLYALLGGSVGNPEPAGEPPFLYADVISDTLLLARRQALGAAGFYDEAMRLYCTEDDICQGMAKAGWRMAVDREVTIVHQLSGSVRKAPPLWVRRIYRDDSLAYYRKHGTAVERVFAAPLMHIAYLLEALALTLGYRMRFRV
jgi:GT2 family glycosyltransferase